MYKQNNVYPRIYILFALISNGYLRNKLQYQKIVYINFVDKFAMYDINLNDFLLTDVNKI